MAATNVRGGQVLDHTIQRVDLDVSTAGNAVITKAIQGGGITLSSTGADAGTGDVTIATTTSKFLCNTGNLQSSLTTDTYMPGSMITVAAGDFPVGCQYRLLIQTVKTAAGTATLVVTIRCGTLGTVSDAALITISPGTQTAVVDTGLIDIWMVMTNSLSAAIFAGVSNLTHNTANGLWATAVGSLVGSVVQGTSTNISAATKIGASYNPGSGGTHTILALRAELVRP